MSLLTGLAQGKFVTIYPFSLNLSFLFVCLPGLPGPES